MPTDDYDVIHSTLTSDACPRLSTNEICRKHGLTCITCWSKRRQYQYQYSLSLCFNYHFSSWTWVSRYQNVSNLDFSGATVHGGGGDNRSCKTCKVSVKMPPPSTNWHPTLLQARCPSRHPANSDRAVKGRSVTILQNIIIYSQLVISHSSDCKLLHQSTCLLLMHLKTLRGENLLSVLTAPYLIQRQQSTNKCITETLHFCYVCFYIMWRTGSKISRRKCWKYHNDTLCKSVNVNSVFDKYQHHPILLYYAARPATPADRMCKMQNQPLEWHGAIRVTLTISTVWQALLGLSSMILVVLGRKLTQRKIPTGPQMIDTHSAGQKTDSEKDTDWSSDDTH